MGTPTGERRYGGKSAEERRAERRERLLDTGLELFGTRGYAGTSIELLCAEAGLNARYFYEEFETRERLLQAVYDRHIDHVFAAVLAAVDAAAPHPAERLRAGLTTFVDQTLADPRAARVNYFEIVGVSSALEARRREVLARYAEMVGSQFAQLLGPGTPPPGGDLHLAAVALVSATDGLIIDRLSDAGGAAAGPEDRLRIVTSLLGIFGAALTAPPAPGH
ncbi:MAG TPA: TetR/AcrR family transcriptional regulator [Solirubrobacteraceae bacterium]|nr:TetR/AcrR family transcriptional regulator [Solirubrobacteraceae bacterium]